MALWQFDCMIIPNKNVFMDTKSDEILSWRDIKMSSDIGKIAQSILPLSKSWSEEILIYGDNDSTCIKLILEKEKMEEIMIRLDLRDLTKKMLMNIIEFINTISGKVLYNEKVYEAKIEVLIPLMKASDAGKFSIDQEKYFKEMIKQSEEPTN